MSVPNIYRKQLGMLRQPFDENTRGVFVPVIQWCADHKEVLKDADADALFAIEEVLEAMVAAVNSCDSRLKELFSAPSEPTDES